MKKPHNVSDAQWDAFVRAQCDCVYLHMLPALVSGGRTYEDAIMGVALALSKERAELIALMQHLSERHAEPRLFVAVEEMRRNAGKERERG